MLLAIYKVINGIGRVDIKAAHGVGSKQHRWCKGYLAADEHLLHIAAGEPAHGGCDARGIDLKLLDYGLGQCLGALAVGEYGLAASERAQHHVLRKIHVADKTHAEPVLGHERECNSHVGDRKRILAQKLFPFAVVVYIADAAGLGGLQARNGLKQLLLAAAGNTCDAENLAGIGGEGHIVELQNAVHAADGETLDLDAGLWVNGVGTVNVQRDRMADHHVGHLLCVGVLGEHIADKLTVAENGNTVGYRLDLMHLVGDDNYRLTVVAHVA